MTKRVGAIITAGGHKYELLHILSINNIKYVPITIHPYRTPNEPIKLKNVYRHILSLRNFSFDIVICNGPGTCVLYCFIAYLLGCKIIYIESIARRDSLSLSGKILEYIAWKFIVQSEKLLTRKRLYHNFFMNE